MIPSAEDPEGRGVEAVNQERTTNPLRTSTPEQNALALRIETALYESLAEFRRNGISALGAKLALADHGIPRLTVQDVALIAAKVATRAAEGDGSRSSCG